MSSVNAVSGPRVIIALDYPTASEALAFADIVSPKICRLKVGFELFTSAGPKVVGDLRNKGFDVFLDLKYHDIPSTVAKACTAAANLGAWMVNVHILGGRDMLCAARASLENSKPRPLLVGVTLLTSHSANDLAAIGLNPDSVALSMRMAEIAKMAELDGVVCSAQEAAAIHSKHGPEFCLVTPGIRLVTGMPDDQQRVMTPAEALLAGAHYLVIGRPITQAPDPLQALETINQNILALS